MNIVVNIERVELESKETFYDFTVDKFENMVVLTSDGVNTGNFLVVHNSPTYEAMVNMVNTPVQLVDGYGNWGSHVEGAAAY